MTADRPERARCPECGEVDRENRLGHADGCRWLSNRAKCRPERAPEGLSAEEWQPIEQVILDWAGTEPGIAAVDKFPEIREVVERIIAARATASAEEVEALRKHGSEVAEATAELIDLHAAAEAEVERLRGVVARVEATLVGCGPSVPASEVQRRVRAALRAVE